jgi:predicted phage terminase large subunit-like protein
MLDKYCPNSPTEKQTLFLALPHREAFYGGAAGGGKSDALLMAALLFVDVPKYAALILRRTYSDLSLPGAIMDRAQAWLRGSDAVWHDTEKTFAFPSGATLTFGYLQTEGDKYRYQGPEFQFVGFDEVTQFTETQYAYLLSRIRRLRTSDVPLRQRSAGNPGGVGHEWVQARFVDSGPERPFIPALMRDNPHLDQAAYRESLAGLDDVTRAQLEDGDWNVRPSGGLFNRAWFQPQDAPYQALARVRAWDLAATKDGGDYSVGIRMARTAGGAFVVEDIVRGQWDVGERDEMLIATAKRDGLSVAIVIEEEGGSSGKFQTRGLAQLLAGYVVSGERPTGPKDVRARPFASQLKAGNARYLTCMGHRDWINELVAFPAGAFDDQVDATSAAFNSVAFQGEFTPLGDELVQAIATYTGW